MGFVSCLEDIQEAIDDNAIGHVQIHLHSVAHQSRTKNVPLKDAERAWKNYLGTRPSQAVIREAREILGDPFAYPKWLITEFWQYYSKSQPVAPKQTSQWEAHLAHLRRLESILNPVEMMGADPAADWSKLREIEMRVQEFFRDVKAYGPVTRDSVNQMRHITERIRNRCQSVQDDLAAFQLHAEKLPPELGKYPLEEDLQRLRTLHGKLSADFYVLDGYAQQTDRAEILWRRFLQCFATIPVQVHYRPVLQDLNRLHLNPQQESIVAMNYEGWHRIQGASGSGKTLIIIHRALRLALENPGMQIRVFTINRSLSEHLRTTSEAIHGQNLPKNLAITSIYDFLHSVLNLFENIKRYRLKEPLSKERASETWRMFFNHRGTSPKHNVFADVGVQRVLSSIETQGKSHISQEGFDKDAAGRYLRDEIVYIQSAYPRSAWTKYLRDPRPGRCLQLKSDQRECCLRVVRAWEEWLEAGEVCDIYGVSTHAARYFDDEHIKKIRAKFPTRHILIDEVQDVSSLELRLLRMLIAKPDSANSFFFAGDQSQKVYVKHHNMASVNFPMTGRVSRLPQNFRNTRQILEAAWCIAAAFPPQVDDAIDILRPNLSIYEGGSPVAIKCSADNHQRVVLDLLRLRKNARVAVVTENEKLLAAIRSSFMTAKMPFFELLRNDDLDKWGKNNTAPLSAKLVIGRLDAVKGYEFDTVIVGDLSAGVTPSPTLPPGEYWREAAVVYSALTRARDELIVTYTGNPSIFMEKMQHLLRMALVPADGQIGSLLSG